MWRVSDTEENASFGQRIDLSRFVFLMLVDDNWQGPTVGAGSDSSCARAIVEEGQLSERLFGPVFFDLTSSLSISYLKLQQTQYYM